MTNKKTLNVIISTFCTENLGMDPVTISKRLEIFPTSLFPVGPVYPKEGGFPKTLDVRGHGSGNCSVEGEMRQDFSSSVSSVLLTEEWDGLFFSPPFTLQPLNPRGSHSLLFQGQVALLGTGEHRKYP